MLASTKVGLEKERQTMLAVIEKCLDINEEFAKKRKILTIKLKVDLSGT